MASSSERSSLYLRVGVSPRSRARRGNAPLLQERLGVDLVLANRARLPSPKRSRGVDLIQRVALCLVVTRDEQADSERPHSSARAQRRQLHTSPLE